MNQLAERWAQKVLQFGFIVALLGIGLGLALRLAGAAHSTVLISIGFWALLCAPTLRVLALFFGFLVQKETKYAWAAAAVLFVLIAGFLTRRL